MRFSSGELNAKHREILELQALAQRRLKSTQANFADGVRAAKEVKRDLDWTQKRVSYVLFFLSSLSSHFLHHSPPFSIKKEMSNENKIWKYEKINKKKDCPFLGESEIIQADVKNQSTLKIKAEKKYPAEYRAANERYPASVDY